MSGWLHVSRNTWPAQPYERVVMMRIWERKKLRTLTAATAEANIRAQPRMSGNCQPCGEP